MISFRQRLRIDLLPRVVALGPVLLPSVIALIVYSPALDLYFFRDDPAQLRWVASRPTASLFYSAEGRAYWRPLAFLAWKGVILATGEFPPRVFHLLNIGLHAANAAIVYLIVHRLAKNRLTALGAGIIFAVHPFNYDIAFIGTLQYPLSAFFLLSAFLSYQWSAERPARRVGFRRVSYVLYGCALLSHESALTFLLILFAYEVLFCGPASLHLGRSFVRHAPYLVITAAYLVWWSQVPKDPLILPPRSLSDPVGGARLFLEGMLFPVQWLIGRVESGLALRPGVLVYPMGIAVILGIGLLRRASGDERAVGLFALWWVSGAVVPLTFLPAGYVLASPRQFYLSSVGAAALWALFLGGIRNLYPWLRISVSRRTTYAAWIVGVPLVFLTALPFIAVRLDAYQKGGNLLREIVSQARGWSADEVAVYVNLPAEVPVGREDPPRRFLPLAAEVDALLEITQGQPRRTETYISEDLGLRQGASDEEAALWRQFYVGDPVSLSDLIRIAVLADHVEIFEFSDWDLYDLDAHSDLLGQRYPELRPVLFLRDQRRQGTPVYLSWPMARFKDLARRYRLDRGVKVFDGRHVLVLHPGRAAYLVEESQDELYYSLGEQSGVKGTAHSRVQVGKANLLAMEIELRPGSYPALPHPVSVTINDKVELIGFGLTSGEGPRLPGEIIELVLYWRVLAPLDKDYTVFVHLQGPTNPTTGNSLWAQGDSYPGQGSYPTRLWEAGEVILDRYVLAVPSDAPPGSYQLRTGMYDLETLERLPIDSERAEAGSLFLMNVEIA